MRWLKSVHPALYRQIQDLLWAQDGLSERECETIDQLLYIGVGDIANLEGALELVWVQDGITETEYDAIYWLRALGYEDKGAAAAIIAMPFLDTIEADDVLAIRGMHSLANDGLLSALTNHPTLRNGITDAQTTLVAATATLQDAEEISRILSPGYATIEILTKGTELTPHLKISIVRTGTQPKPWTAEAVKDAVEFAERTMQLPLPVDHVIAVLNDKAVTGNAAGTNHGYAIGYLPEYEQGQDNYDRYKFQSGIVHEVAHYFWRGNEDWIDEGLANIIEYMHGVEGGISPGFLKNRRMDCEVHDLESLASWNLGKGNLQFRCNYYLGQNLFQELLEALGEAEFKKRLPELYQLSLAEQEEQRTPGTKEVRQVFQDQADIIEKHWSGKLNAPENQPFDEGVDRSSHSLIQWDQYPTYDGRSVTFSGTLLGDAVLSKETMQQARKGGYQNYLLTPADERTYEGSILPPFSDGRNWKLDDPGDTVATRYLFYDDGKTFTVEFPFPKALGNPSDYVVLA